MAASGLTGFGQADLAQIALVLSVVPFEMDGYHLNLKVTLNGRVILAALNTGSERTTLMAPAAKRIFGLTADSHGVSVANPYIVVVPDLLGSKDPDNRFQTGSIIKRVDDHPERPELSIGMDVLRHLHLYIAFREHKLYITPGRCPQARQPCRHADNPIIKVRTETASRFSMGEIALSAPPSKCYNK